MQLYRAETPKWVTSPFFLTNPLSPIKRQNGTRHGKKYQIKGNSLRSSRTSTNNNQQATGTKQNLEKLFLAKKAPMLLKTLGKKNFPAIWRSAHSSTNSRRLENRGGRVRFLLGCPGQQREKVLRNSRLQTQLLGLRLGDLPQTTPSGALGEQKRSPRVRFPFLKRPCTAPSRIKHTSSSPPGCWVLGTGITLGRLAHRGDEEYTILGHPGQFVTGPRR